MSAFTDRLYREWLRGYGAQPHGSEAQRSEGYPMNQPKRLHSLRPLPAACPSSARNATTRTGTPCAKDATSRPDKPAVPASRPPLFLPFNGKNFQ